MTVGYATYLIMGALAGGFINELSGSGTALFALGFHPVVLDPIRAVATMALMSVLACVQGLWIVRREIKANPRRLLRFLIPGLTGVPIGLSLLAVVYEQTLRVFTVVFTKNTLGRWCDRLHWWCARRGIISIRCNSRDVVVDQAVGKNGNAGSFAAVQCRHTKHNGHASVFQGRI